jgi:cysteine desulfurase/selenocysteine lyase
MTTPPATGSGLPAGTNGQSPAGLPDEATLSRLAGEFFRALPGSAPQPVGPNGTAPGTFGGTESPGAPFDPPVVAAPPTAPVPSQPPPTSTFATYSATAGNGVLPFVPEVPSMLGAAGPVPALDVPVLPGGDFYFLSGTPNTAIPPGPPTLQLPGLDFPAVPSVVAADPPTAERPGFYFLDAPGPATIGGPHPPFDVEAVRADFPILAETVNGRPLVWLDNAATTQKPNAVIDRLAHFYRHENSNIHRAAHELAARASDAYENARRTAAEFLGAGGPEEIVFVRGTTEAINLVAKAWGRKHIGAGDEIVISHLEHHANIVPWQMLAEEVGATIKVIPVDDDGQVLLERVPLSDRTKLVAITQVSNALGTVVPVAEIVELGHRAGAKVLVDAAQSAPHIPIDVQAMGADFLAFSGHKVFGPTGIGVLYGRPEVLADMPPWEGGGNMIKDVTLERSVFQEPPGRFEAGTGNIADAVGLAAALDYVSGIGLPLIAEYEHSLVEHATAGLRDIPGLRLVGTAPDKASVVSFLLAGWEPAEVGAALNEEGIAVRAGHHCAQPILRRYGLEATVRPSFAFYNTHHEVDVLVEAVRRLAAQRPAH